VLCLSAYLELTLQCYSSIGYPVELGSYKELEKYENLLSPCQRQNLGPLVQKLVFCQLYPFSLRTSEYAHRNKASQAALATQFS